MGCSYNPFFINDGTSTEPINFITQKHLWKQNYESYYIIYLIQNKKNHVCCLEEWAKCWLLGAGRSGVFLESVSFEDELVFLEHNQKSHFWNSWTEWTVIGRGSTRWGNCEEMASFDDSGPLDSFSRWVRFSDSTNCFTGIWQVHSETHLFDSWGSIVITESSVPAWGNLLATDHLKEKNYWFFQDVFSSLF